MTSHAHPTAVPPSFLCWSAFPLCSGALLPLVFVVPVAAQDFSTTVLLCRSDATSSVVLGDIDGDGDLDIIYGNGRHYPKQSLIYFNDGAGAFHGEYPLFPAARKTYAVALGDLDGDGDVDVVEGTDFGDYDQVFFNAGNETFFAGPLLDDGDGLGGRGRAVRAVVIDDLDGDDALDIVLATRGGPDFVFWNDGSGQAGARRHSTIRRPRRSRPRRRTSTGTVMWTSSSRAAARM